MERSRSPTRSITWHRAQESGLFPRAQTCSHWVFNKCDFCNSTFNWTRFPSNLLRKILNNRIPQQANTLTKTNLHPPLQYQNVKIHVHYHTCYLHDLQALPKIFFFFEKTRSSFETSMVDAAGICIKQYYSTDPINERKIITLYK